MTTETDSPDATTPPEPPPPIDAGWDLPLEELRVDFSRSANRAPFARVLLRRGVWTVGQVWQNAAGLLVISAPRLSEVSPFGGQTVEVHPEAVALVSRIDRQTCEDEIRRHLFSADRPWRPADGRDSRGLGLAGQEKPRARRKPRGLRPGPGRPRPAPWAIVTGPDQKVAGVLGAVEIKGDLLVRVDVPAVDGWGGFVRSWPAASASIELCTRQAALDFVSAFELRRPAGPAPSSVAK